MEAAISKPYALIVTSCGRFDLLKRTLASFFEYADQRPAEIIVIEDSGDEAVRQHVATVAPEATVIVNRPQLGQMRAIDKAYAAATTPYVFHCEDDWLFERGGFIAESFAILDAFPDVSMVGLRPREELNPLIRDMPEERLGTVAFFRLDPTRHPEYFSYSFNPGLRRMEDFRRFAPVAALGTEEDVSYAFKKAGFRIANLEAEAVRHIGDERHVDDPTTRKRPKRFLAKLARSVRKRWKRLRRALAGK
jgi:hypothetical protein